MAFQTSVLRDGEWVTETVSLQAALKASVATEPASDPLPKPPICGILSRTIVESPIIHWVLPIRLRSNSHNDFAFIGDHFVQISELGKDGQTSEVLRKSDFGARIRNAVVLGDSLEHGLDDDIHVGNIKLEPSSSEFNLGWRGSLDGIQTCCLPPQLLVLILETGQLLFLFIRPRIDESLEFFIAKQEPPKPLLYLGYQLAVDPSSRYIAAASPDGVFVMYELESLSDLNEQYSNQNSIHPVKSMRVRMIQGVIHKLEFLFPRPEDDYHIILLLIVVRKGRNHGIPVSRMVTYEWELGDNLQGVFAEEKIGTLLPKEHRMPMLLIPLRFKAAFFAVSRFFIGVVKYALSGSPEFELLPTDSPMRTKLHHGISEPLWTAWARPFRRKKYFERTDIIYLAREDGAIIHVEIDAAELVPSVTNVGCLETNINTAFATAYDIFSDVLIIGGDSGPGGIWKLAPREDLKQVSLLPNWSPVVDITTTNEYSTWDSNSITFSTDQSKHHVLPNNLRKQDSIFSASGRGLKGSVTQWRWGFQARIGLDIETGEQIKQAWTFSINYRNDKRLYGLLALPHSSVLLQFSEDLGQVDAIPAGNTPFDLNSRTLSAIQYSETVVQITESSINVITPTGNSRCLLEEILDVAGLTAGNASCGENIIVLSTHTDQGSQLHTMEIEGVGFSTVASWDAQGEVTCVSSFSVAESVFVVAGSMSNGVPWISIYSVSGELVVEQPLDKQRDDCGNGLSLEAMTSICVVRQNAEEIGLILGTRCGRLVTARVAERSPDHVTWVTEIVGVSRVDVFSAFDPSKDMLAALACCDDNLILMTDLAQNHCLFKSKHLIWLTDSNDASMPSPPIHSVSQVAESLLGIPGHLSLMILAGSRLLLADVIPHIGLVPRSIPVEGTPTRIIYSQTLNCLVVALLKGDRPSLLFVDPETGMSISVPTDKDKIPTDFISGLGHPGDRIYGIYEWLYVKDGKMFPFILVTTKDGRLIIVSTEKIDPAPAGPDEGAYRRLRYWTRYKKQLGNPIYSIVGDDEGLIFCVGRTLHWDVLDLTEKRLKPMKEFELDSPAISLRVVNGRIYALTTMHSLEVVDYRGQDRAEMELKQTDQVSRRTVHMIELGDHDDMNNGHQPLTLISDQSGGIAGIWVPPGQRDREFEVIIEGMLPCSIRRFARAHNKPPWHLGDIERRYGTLPSTTDGADIIGVSVDGSMQQFSLLSLELWRILCLVQKLAQRSTILAPVHYNSSPLASESDDMTLEPRPHPRSMHINGDLLDRCIKLQVLEQVIGTGPGLELFCKYLDMLEDGRYTNEFKSIPEGKRKEKYFEIGYCIIRFLVAL